MCALAYYAMKSSLARSCHRRLDNPLMACVVLECATYFLQDAELGLLGLQRAIWTKTSLGLTMPIS